MKVEIKRLSLELTKDYMDYFDNVAFSDNSEWSGCYCVWYHWNDELENECSKYTADGGGCFKRELAIKYIQNGILQGYLAYADGSVVGWCNANDRANYDRLSKEKYPEIWRNVDCNESVKSIVCFTIAPHMRRKGIAAQLLDRVCSDACEEGYTYVEAYPETGKASNRSYHGPYALYEKYGFSVYKDLGNEAIVRKYL
ncbi:GNAT family N-acetyltransferase [Clostridium oryzae]|uniref:Acetyltransferase (GNAT) family protein n=1 Tax=Clostridium oryzae TaxID=1450648 RepID=A0A1V4IWI2_9CLOT|nr:GNAT family N-acetyltransferase [Clostridium oryzae]OPJ63777.1 acetyltransferase (GNAT) family protein [Clostridium oryzae]